MSDVNAKQAEFEAKFREYNKAKLISEYDFIRRNHKKENMMDDLVRMSAVIKVMEEKGIPLPDQKRARPVAQGQPSYGQLNNNASYASAGPNWGKVVIGALIMMVGIGLTVGNTGRIFYGAILVGLFMMIGGLAGA